MNAQKSFLSNQPIEKLIEHGYQLLLPCSDSAKLDAQILLCLVVKKELSYLLTWPEKSIEPLLVEHYLNLLARRQTGEPIAYITGTKEFWSLPLMVSTATLIPRPDTEILVEKVLEVYSGEKYINCLDLGTGTGAIALALASENSTWSVEGIDYSVDAITLAKMNAKTLQLSQVNFYQSDWFSNVAPGTKFDLIVSNPPYIDEHDENLSHGDVRFEPKSALVAPNHGLADICNIAKLSRGFLANSGTLFFEHGFDQGKAVREVMLKLDYKKVQTIKDLSGHDRVTWATFES